MTRYLSLGLVWTAFNTGEGMHRAEEGRVTRRLAHILNEWEGTPYVPGQCVKRGGAFCTAFLCAVLDELYRRPDPTPLPEVPQDAAMHSPETARAGLRWFLERYPNHRKVEDGLVQPGDVLVTGPRGGGPGHGILVGPRENTMWQCSGYGVHYTGFAVPGHYRLYAAYRMTDREKWF